MLHHALSVLSQNLTNVQDQEKACPQSSGYDVRVADPGFHINQEVLRISVIHGSHGCHDWVEDWRAWWIMCAACGPGCQGNLRSTELSSEGSRCNGLRLEPLSGYDKARYFSHKYRAFVGLCQAVILAVLPVIMSEATCVKSPVMSDSFLPTSIEATSTALQSEPEPLLPNPPPVSV